MATYTAVDLGATSGRIVNVAIDGDAIRLDEVHRFPNGPVATVGGGTWELDRLLVETLRGIAAAAEGARVRSIGVDGWGVDYGLLTASGELAGPVHAYRSHRTDGVMGAVTARLGRDRIYAVTGTQFLPFNTAYQLVCDRGTPAYEAATSLLMIPDLVNHHLCGSVTNDITNASTTQLLDIRQRAWSEELVSALELRAELLPALHEPGTHLGAIKGDDAGAARGTPVVAVGSHDTASAVAGTPLDPSRPGIYVSCGTWALVGCELPGPVTSGGALAANVTNELGVDGRTRLLKNVTGLWLLEECRRAWTTAGDERVVAALVAAAAAEPAGLAIIDPDDVRFAAADHMPTAVADACRGTGQPAPATPSEVTRVLIDSLAASIRRTVAIIEQIGGARAEVIHLVGGGALNAILAAACASACERPVHVGPVEATVIGNALVQAIADTEIPDLSTARRLVAESFPPTVVEPTAMADWDALADRIG